MAKVKPLLPTTTEYLNSVREEAIKEAKRRGMKIRIEQETRGRYSSLIVRAVGELGGMDELILESEIINGVKIKPLTKADISFKVR